MTDIVTTPNSPEVPAYPALGAANFNAQAYAYGSAMPEVSYRIWQIGKAAETNATASSESAQTAAVQADLAMGYRNQAGASAGSASESAGVATAKAAEATQAAVQAVPAAEAALAAAQRAEEAAASIQDGPVTRVNGKTGDVTLSAVDVGAVAESTILARMQAIALCF